MIESDWEFDSFIKLYNGFVPKKGNKLSENFWSHYNNDFKEFESELTINSIQYYFHINVERIQSSNHSSFIVTIKDITKSKKEEESRKLAEESLRINERKFFDLVNNLPVSITRFIIESNTYEFSNHAFEEQFGASINVLRALTPAERLAYIHEEDLPNVMEAFNKWASENYKGVMTLDYRGYKYNKDHLWLKNFLYADFNEKNQPYALNQIGVDVSNLKNAEIALTKALRNDFRTTVQNLLNLVIRIRKDKKSYIVMFCEGILANELGLSVENEVPFTKHFDLTLRKALQPSIEYCFSGKSVQNEMYFNNRYILFWFQPITIDNVTTEIVGSAVDITIQKEVQHKLRESDQLQSMLIELLPIGVIQYSYFNNNANESFVFERTNPVLLQLLNIKSIDLLHRNVIREIMSEFSLPSYNQQVQLWDSKNDGSLFKMNVQFKSDNPSEVQWVQIHQTKYQISDFQSRYICVLIDISKEKYDEIRLKHLASFAEQTPMIIVEVDIENNSIYVNPYAIERFPTIESEGIMHAMFQSIDLKQITSFPQTFETELD
jgi:PAS domain-containing protein